MAWEQMASSAVDRDLRTFAKDSPASNLIRLATDIDEFALVVRIHRPIKRRPQINQLDPAILINEHIRGLDVPMRNLHRM